MQPMNIGGKRGTWRKAAVVSMAMVLLLSLTVVSGGFAEEKQIRILHVNDFHGFAEPYKPLGSQELLGGAAYLSTAVNRLRGERPTLLVAGGDMIQGHTWANLSKGESAIELMNAMRFDVMVMGNHELDFGQEILIKRISEATFPVLAANVSGLEGLKPYVIKEVEGVKVGFLGVVAEDTPVITHPNNVTGLRFGLVQETVEKYLPEVRGKSDIVVVLSHIGYPADRILAENVKGIDVIIGAHFHTKVVDPPVIGETLIVQAWEHAKVLGVVDITLEGGRIKIAKGTLEEIKPVEGLGDKAVEAIVFKYKQVVDATLNQIVGAADVDLDGENIRRRETNLGNLIADIIRDTSNADAALINSGAIRTDIRKGDIRAKDVYSVVPFDNYIVTIKVKGRQIREALEHGYSAVEKGVGGFPQVSGIFLKYDLSMPPGSRITEIRVKGRPLDPEEEYTVATIDFIASGGDGYKAFGDAITSSRDYAVVGGAMKGEKVVYSDPGTWLRDMVIRSIQSRGRVSPQIEGRMTPVGK
jgi:5'-nucleotidase/UDP-sugar diphosphatase